MKSIHFNQVPNMRGRKTMRFTDVTLFNAREKLNERFDARLAQFEIGDNPTIDPIYDRWYDWEEMYDDD